MSSCSRRMKSLSSKGVGDESFPLPVSSKRPKLDTSGLRTGALLQWCSGSDVQLARGASVSSSTAVDLSKNKGRFLFVLPGILSPHTSTRQPKESLEPEDPAIPSADEGSGPTSAAAPTALLGKVEKISTDSPILRVSFPSGDLIFRGRKVSTSTRFMSLTCKGAKGAVVCKDIFSSVIIFDSQHEKERNADGMDDKVTVEDISIRHLGGSSRANNGLAKRFTSVKRKKRDVVAATTAKPGATKHDTDDLQSSENEDEVVVFDDDDDDDDDDFSDEDYYERTNKIARLISSLSTRRTPRRSADKVNYADQAEESDDDQSSDSQAEQIGDESEQSEPKLPTPKSRGRAKGRESVAHRSKIETVTISDDEDTNFEPSQTAKKSRRTSVAKNGKEKPVIKNGIERDRTERVTQATRQTNPKPSRPPSSRRLVLDSDDDEFDMETTFNSEGSPQKETARKMPSRRSSSKVTKKEEGSDDESTLGDEPEEGPDTNENESVKTGVKNVRRNKRKNIDEEEESLEEDSSLTEKENTLTKKENQNADVQIDRNEAVDNLLRKRKASNPTPARKQEATAANNNATSTKSSTGSQILEEKGRDSKKEFSTCSSLSVVRATRNEDIPVESRRTSPLRTPRRRKKSSPTKSPKQKLEIDLSNDDAFVFLD